MALIKKEFGTTSTGKTIYSFEITNKLGEVLTVINYGARIQGLKILGADDRLHDVILGYDTVIDYEQDPASHGAFIGRCGNRIAKGKFTLNGKEYQLEINNGENHLHGGSHGYSTQIYDEFTTTDNSVTFRRLSPDGEANYPGNLQVAVTYTFDDSSCLSIAYEATTDADTVVNLTNHSYFNLDGEGSGKVYAQELKLACEQMVPVDANLIPTGEKRDVRGTVFDFTQFKTIGQDIEAEDEQLLLTNGYDHTFLLPAHEGLYEFATARSQLTGITMKVATTLPGVQLYTANFLNGLAGKHGHCYQAREAFCLETHFVPNAINCAEFTAPILRQGETMHSLTTYKFSR